MASVLYTGCVQEVSKQHDAHGTSSSIVKTDVFSNHEVIGLPSGVDDEDDGDDDGGGVIEETKCLLVRIVNLLPNSAQVLIASTSSTTRRQTSTATESTYTMPSPDVDDKRKAAREVIDILHEIATLLARPPSFGSECTH